MLADQFTLIFREEHRIIRDALLDLIEAFGKRDRIQIQALLKLVASETGPHFRYEEEALYPGLIEILGEEYIEKLLSDHDRVIQTAKRLLEFANQDALTDEDIGEAAKRIRGILPHVSDCDGLSIMVERLPDDKVKRIVDARDRSRLAGLDLLQWVNRERKRFIVEETHLKAA